MGYLTKTMLFTYFFLGLTLLLIPLNFYTDGFLPEIHVYSQIVLTISIIAFYAYTIKGRIEIQRIEK